MVRFRTPEGLWGVWAVLLMWVVLSVATLATFTRAPAASAAPVEIHTVDAGMGVSASEPLTGNTSAPLPRI